MPANFLSGGISLLKRRIVIVGHGLAGAILAHTLLKNNESVIVLDANMPHSATAVSVGLINPFIGPKLNVPNDFASCMEENLDFFQDPYFDTDYQFIEKISLLRIFQSKEQKYKWEQITDIYKDSTVSCLACKNLGIISALGAGKTHAWKMKAKEFIKYSKTKLLSQNSYLSEPFIPEKWKGFRVIFCDGYRATQNQWFKDLPFSPAQGEVMDIHSGYKFNASNGTWHLKGKVRNTAKIGSTWRHENIESGPTQAARKEILTKIKFLPALNGDKILNHRSGIRSSTVDRQPMLGRHPEFKNYYLFNGFGSRGCTTISLNAKQFFAYLCHGAELPAHKDIKRFYS
mgnify:CR=1 FL=1